MGDRARPLVSVVIKTLNEEEKIGACLTSVLEATKPYRTQIIVADSRSEDATVAVARRFGVDVIRLAPTEPRGCGIGAQLGFQYSAGEYVLLLDGDMRLAAGFLPAALQTLEADRSIAGVAGRLDLDDANLEYRLRRDRYMPHLRSGPVDRLDGGGLYRRAAIDSVGYLTDRNLHSYEEFELALRLRAVGWRLVRLAATSVHHYGHRTPATSLLMRRWRSRYTDGQGEVLRATLGSKSFALAVREFWLSFAVIAWWGCLLAAALAPPLPWPPVVALALLPLLLTTARRRSIVAGCYTFALWQVIAAGLIRGFLRRRIDPRTPVTAEILTESAEIPAAGRPRDAGAPAASRAVAAPRAAVLSKPIAQRTSGGT
jgi:GT2 family glycosyltransferase